MASSPLEDKLAESLRGVLGMFPDNMRAKAGEGGIQWNQKAIDTIEKARNTLAQHDKLKPKPCKTCNDTRTVLVHEPSPAGGPDWITCACSDCGVGLERKKRQQDEDRYGNF